MQFSGRLSKRVPRTGSTTSSASLAAPPPFDRAVPVSPFRYGTEERTIPFAIAMEYHTRGALDDGKGEEPIRVEVEGEGEEDQELPLFKATTYAATFACPPSSATIAAIPLRTPTCYLALATQHRRRLPLELWVGEVCPFLPFKASVALSRVNRTFHHMLMGRPPPPHPLGVGAATTPSKVPSADLGLSSPFKSPSVSQSFRPRAVRISYRQALQLEFGLTQSEWSALQVFPYLEFPAEPATSVWPSTSYGCSPAQLVFKERPHPEGGGATSGMTVDAERSADWETNEEDEEEEKARLALRTLYLVYAFCVRQQNQFSSVSTPPTPGPIGSYPKQGSWVRADGTGVAGGTAAMIRQDSKSETHQQRLSWVKVRLNEVSIGKVNDLGRLCRALAHHAKWKKLCEGQTRPLQDNESVGAADGDCVAAATPLTPPPAATLSQSSSEPSPSKDPHDLVLQSIVSVVERLQGVLVRTAPAGERARYHRLLVEEQQRLLSPLAR
jgi:hypothetical protein